MSYHRSGQPFCVPQEAILRVQPRAAGPLFRELVTLVGPYEAWPVSPTRGLLVVDPRYDTLPLGPGWEWRV